MTEELVNYEKSIKKKGKFGWTPKYEEKIRTQLDKRLFIEIAIKTFEKIGWDIVSRDEVSVVANRKGSWNKWTERITASYQFGNIIVKSESLGNEMWDMGRNSKRVKLFIYVYEQTEKEYDGEALEELRKTVEKQDNWDDYEIPESLPKPKNRITPQPFIPIAGGLAIALITGYLIALLTFKAIYIIGIFEVGAALIIAFGFKYLIRLSNYTNIQLLQYLLGVVVFITYLSNQYFLYELILENNNLERIGFLEFLKWRLENGLTIKSLNTGWIGLVISWIFQLGITWAIAYLRLIHSLTTFVIKRVPTEVADFTMYHFVKGKSENEVRLELSKKGWSTDQQQNEAFEAIGGYQSANELGRV